MAFELREYQSAAIDALLGGWDNGGQRLAVVLPTGAGKTVVFSHLIRELRRTRRIARVLVLAHREELLEQAADKIRKVSPHLRVGIVKGGRNEHDNAHVVVASVQTMSYRRPCRNQQVDEDGNPMGRCNQCSRCSVLPRAEQIKGIQAIIVDEARSEERRVGKECRSRWAADA